MYTTRRNINQVVNLGHSVFVCLAQFSGTSHLQQLGLPSGYRLEFCCLSTAVAVCECLLQQRKCRFT